MNHINILKEAILIVIFQQQFKSEAHNVFSEEVHKILLNSNNDKIGQSIDYKETDVYIKSANIVGTMKKLRIAI